MMLPPLRRPVIEGEGADELYRKITQCVRCGVCLATCPTYRELIHEADSPRGRIALMRAVSEGDAEITPKLQHFLYGCLECRACETACPNNVVFHEVMEWGKEQLSSRKLLPPAGRFFKWLFLRRVFRRARSLDRFMAFIRFYRRSGLQALARFTRILKLFPWHLGDLERLLPTRAESGRHRPARGRRTYTLAPAGEVRGRVLFFSGCIADHWLQGANHATLRLLLRAGFAVTVPSAQQCCGALHVHLGEPGLGKELARENIEAFAAAGGDEPIITNAAGCGAALKDYAHLLEHDREFARRATAFSGRVRDISEFLASLDGAPPPPGRLDKRVTYDDPCHLIHGQGISHRPRELLRGIPGIEFVELEEASWCCGSAGVYNIIHYDMAMALLRRKLENFKRTGAEVLVSANPGCLLQLKAGLRRERVPAAVLHIAEVLDGAYASEPELAPGSDPPPWR